MSQCRICSSPRKGEVNKLLLNGAPMTKVAKACGLSVQAVKNHRKRHLPWRSERRPKPVTTAEKFSELEYQLERLRFLAESGEPVGGALRVLFAQKSLLELEMRAEGRLDPMNKKKMLATAPLEDIEIVFENGRPRSIEKVSA
jgi:hypothetical protein